MRRTRSRTQSTFAPVIFANDQPDRTSWWNHSSLVQITPLSTGRRLRLTCPRVGVGKTSGSIFAVVAGQSFFRNSSAFLTLSGCMPGHTTTQAGSRDRRKTPGTSSWNQPKMAPSFLQATILSKAATGARTERSARGLSTMNRKSFGGGIQRVISRPFRGPIKSEALADSSKPRSPI